MVFPILLIVVIAFVNRIGAQAPKAEDAKMRIVPVVVLKPGETKELLLSTWCTVGITRGKGLSVRELRADGNDPFPDKNRKDPRVWTGDGVTVKVPDFDEATEFTRQAKFKPLAKDHIEVFKVTVSAAKDAKPRAFEMHLADNTCAGTCTTDFRVLVVGD
jgi:hypothetical protein